jgi:hypothetical protein
MIKTVPMNQKQAELINAAHQAVKQSREQRDMDVLLEGIAAGLEGKLVNADTDTSVFTVEVPDEKTSAEKTAE